MLNKKKTIVFALAFILMFVLFVPHAKAEWQGLIPGECLKDVKNCNFTTFIELIRNVINYLIIITTSIAAIVFAWAGVIYMTASGDEGKISKAHEMFWKVLKGLVFMLAAYLIVYAITTGLLLKSDYSLLK